MYIYISIYVYYIYYKYIYIYIYIYIYKCPESIQQNKSNNINDSKIFSYFWIPYLIFVYLRFCGRDCFNSSVIFA